MQVHSAVGIQLPFSISEASQLYERDRLQYNKRVREIVEQSWIDTDSKEKDAGDAKLSGDP